MVKDTKLKEDCKDCEFYKEIIKYIVNGKNIKHCTLSEVPKYCKSIKNKKVLSF